MKNLIAFAFLFACVIAYTQDENLPQIVETAFKNKYPTSKLDSWRVDNDLYYLDFYIKTNSYTSVFDKKGGWVETSEIISDFDIPVILQDYITDTYPDGRISYCEKVETKDSSCFFRVSLYNNEEFFVIESNNKGTNIKIIKHEAEQ